jgi:23S rRNA pseudouridine1911/1915/1917 synthase
MSRDFKILFEDNHLLVIDKPALLPTMGVRDGEDSLVNQVKDYLRQKYNKPGNVYLGVVSRLDSFVSGVIVLARTSKAASRLTDQFRRRAVSKNYLAIVPDIQSLPDFGQLQDRLIKDESLHRMVALNKNSPAHPQEKAAKLSFRTLGRHDGQRLLAISLETGRKHQIRVQLAAAGCPVIGDRKYKSPETFKKGIALHSHRLAFEHPTTKETQSFQTDPPRFWRIDRFGYDGNVTADQGIG